MEVTALKALVVSLLAWIHLFTGFDIPEEDPYITAVPHQVLERMACEGKCPILGLYPRDGVIYLDENLQPETNICARSILLHELVHFVQEANGRFADRDPLLRWQFREAEAHRIQNVFLKQNGRRFLFGRHVANRAFMGPHC